MRHMCDMGVVSFTMCFVKKLKARGCLAILGNTIFGSICKTSMSFCALYLMWVKAMKNDHYVKVVEYDGYVLIEVPSCEYSILET